MQLSHFVWKGLGLCLFVGLFFTSAGVSQAQDEEIPPPDTVTIAGTLQPLVGCDGEWDPSCEASMLIYDEEDDLWMGAFELPAGSYEYKAALNGGWDANYGLNAEWFGPNIPLEVEEAGEVIFWYSHKTGWVTDNINSKLANIPGSYQDEIGCPGEWAPDCLRSLLQDPEGDGTYVFQTDQIPAGSYEAKVAENQSWDVNYGEGGAQDGANILFSVPQDGDMVTFLWDSRSGVMTIAAGEGGGMQGNIAEQRAHWVSADTVAWNIEHEEGNQYFFHYNTTAAGFTLGFEGIEGGDVAELMVNEAGIGEEAAAKFPHLASYTALTLPDNFRARTALKGQLAVSARTAEGEMVNATGLQIPGVLDALYPYDGDLGVTFDDDGVPTIRVWAPTALSVRFHLFPDESRDSEAVQPMRIDTDTGVWSVTGEPSWMGKYYLFEVDVFVPSEGARRTNIVSDPYSVSLSQNSGRSQIIDLTDPEFMPEGWGELTKPEFGVPEEIVVYELHIRDFSANDGSVPEELQGTYKAFTLAESNGMMHLSALAEAGLTHLHLLPSFDIATVEEDRSAWGGPTFDELSGFAADSEEPQALISAVRDQDGFNWGYDPWHYNVPEGSYSTDANGTTRIVEYREMVQALNETGLRVVVDVVYNHTTASGQGEKSVLDRIVPGYYHRLNAAGSVERSTCCDNTATEHDMMRKLMIDSIILWATQYKVDGFRFDLMGHHMKSDMLAVREALDGLTLAEHGVDGSSIYVYGEGWNFGEVANDARGVNATQLNMAGTGIGTFSDRLRDAVRGGNPFGGQTEQGFLTGLVTDPNSFDQGTENEQAVRLKNFTDQIRVGLAGNLSGYEFIGSNGEMTTGAAVLYNGSPSGYTEDPQEQIVYISKHDNETLFDVIQYKAADDVTTEDRARMQTLGNAVVMLSQGVPFFQAGDDLLRSKSLDRNSYNSGDWFNRLDFTYQSNNWGIGLPPAADNEGVWGIMQPLLANPEIAPTPEDIAFARDTFREFLQIQASSPLFSLTTAEDVQTRLAFHNTGAEQIPGLIVMSLSDVIDDGVDLDENADMIVVLFNANPEAVDFTAEAVEGMSFDLHPVQQESVDGRLAEAAYENDTFTVPGRTAAVFVTPQGGGRASDEDRAEAGLVVFVLGFVAAVVAGILAYHWRSKEQEG